MPHSSILSFSFKKEAWSFWAVTGLIFLLFLGVFEHVLYHVGETISYAQVIQDQQQTNALYSPKFFNVQKDYKILGIKARRPQILAMGTSRIMPMRQNHFSDGIVFYNAGVDASSSGEIDGMREMLQELKTEELPKVIIWGIDPWIFNPHYPPNLQSFKQQFLEGINRQAILRGLYDFYQFVDGRLKAYDLLVKEKKNWLKFLLGNDTQEAAGIGLNAKFFHTGFAVDGSFIYPSAQQDDVPKTALQWQEYLRDDRYRFASADRLDEAAMQKLYGFLQYCHERGIVVIGLLLPFRPDFFQALNQDASFAPFFKKFREEIPRAMRRFYFNCYDYSSPDSLDLSSASFIDNNHMKPAGFDKICRKIEKDWNGVTGIFLSSSKP